MKKIVKIVFIILVIIVLGFIGRKIYYSTVEIKPDDLYLTKENLEGNIKMNIGTYSWEDKGANVVVDSIPAQDMENLKTLNVKQNEKVVFTDCDWISSNARILLVHEGTVAGFAIESNPEEHYIIVPNMEGEYIVQIDLKSKKGDVWYAAKLNISK